LWSFATDRLRGVQDGARCHDRCQEGQKEARLSTTPKGGGGAGGGKDRHQEILDAAARVITARGLAETRISDIADQAGVSPGLILYYFESKDRLLSEALTFANDQFYLRTSREIRRLPSAVDQLRRLVDLSVPGYLPEYGRLDEWALWIEVWVRALRDADMAKEMATFSRNQILNQAGTAILAQANQVPQGVLSLLR